MAQDELNLSINVDTKKLDESILRIQNQSRNLLQQSVNNTNFGSFVAMQSAQSFQSNNILARQAFNQSFSASPTFYTTSPFFNVQQGTQRLGTLPGDDVLNYKKTLSFTDMRRLALGSLGKFVYPFATMDYRTNTSFTDYVGIKGEQFGQKLTNTAYNVLGGVTSFGDFMADKVMPVATVGGMLIGGIGKKLGYNNAFIRGASKLGMFGATTAMWMAQAAAKVTNDIVQDSREFYNLGMSYRGAVAPYTRSGSLYGGPSGADIRKFIRGVGELTRRDKILSFGDYRSFFDSIVQENMTMFNTSPDKMIKSMEAIGKNVKMLMTLGMKTQEIMPTLRQLNQMGYTMDRNHRDMKQFLGKLSLVSTQANKDVSELLATGQQYSYMGRQQGVSMRVGTDAYLSSVGAVSEMMRGGKLSHERVQELGGKENVERNVSNVITSNQSSALGRLYNIYQARRLKQGKDVNPNVTYEEVLADTGGITAEEYLNIDYEMPFISQKMAKIDPNLQTWSQLKFNVDAKRKMLGKKRLSIGELHALLVNSGSTPDESRAMIETILNSDNIANNTKETVYQKLTQATLEANRPWFNPFEGASYSRLYRRAIAEPASMLGGAVAEASVNATKFLQNKYVEFFTGHKIYEPPKINIADRLVHINKLAGKRQILGSVNESITEDNYQDWVKRNKNTLNKLILHTDIKAGDAKEDLGLKRDITGEEALSSMQLGEIIEDYLQDYKKNINKTYTKDTKTIDKQEAKNILRTIMYKFDRGIRLTPEEQQKYQQARKTLEQGTKEDKESLKAFMKYINNETVSSLGSRTDVKGFQIKKTIVQERMDFLDRMSLVQEGIKSDLSSVEKADLKTALGKLDPADLDKMIKGKSDEEIRDIVATQLFDKQFKELDSKELRTYGLFLDSTRAIRGKKQSKEWKSYVEREEKMDTKDYIKLRKGTIEDMEKLQKDAEGTELNRLLKNAFGDKLLTEEEIKAFTLGMADKRGEDTKYLEDMRQKLKENPELLEFYEKGNKMAPKQGHVKNPRAPKVERVQDRIKEEDIKKVADYHQALAENTLSQDQLDELGKRFSALGVDINARRDVKDILSKQKIEDKDLDKLTEVLSGSKDKNFASVSTLIKDIKSKASNEDIMKSYEHFISDLGVSQEDRGRVMEEFKKVLEKGDNTATVRTLIQQSLAGQESMPITSNIGSGMLTQEAMDELIKGMQSQQQVASILMDIKSSLDTSGIMGMEKLSADHNQEAFKKIGEAIAKGMMENPQLKQVLIDKVSKEGAKQ